ncbi:diguanylate cyclase [uncultured Faecalibacterium sp.]|uniref:diguanylate cyclase n=1 Tax=uncultured Faecalibacterium sp. TaxID=259315 RepID=UPI0026DDCAAA|nr:HD domain-containing phosphohydrolase [uncultured Faecalibacterium sp.]
MQDKDEKTAQGGAMTRQQAEQEMEQLRKVFPSVRMLTAEQVQAGEALGDAARQALEEKTTHSRMEYRGQELYEVTALFAQVEGTPCVLELERRLDRVMLLDPEESEQLFNNLAEYRGKLYRDAVTGAYNERYYQEKYRSRILTAGVAVLRVDDFKAANDVYGRCAGNSVLETVAGVLRRNLGEKDRLIRRGEDRLLLLLPEVGQSDFGQKLEHLRLQLAAAGVPGYSHLHISVSIGGVWIRDGEVSAAVEHAERLATYAQMQKNTVITEQQPERTAAAPVHRRQSVLIVDDSELNRKMLGQMLGSRFDIAEAASGEACLQLLEQNATGISIVLLDIHMPGIDGFTVLEEMNQKNLLEQIPVIMISSEDTVDAVRRAFDLGASDYISRPFDAKVVYQRIINTIQLYAKQRRLSAMAADLAFEKERASRMMIGILSQVVEKRNGESRDHVQRVAQLTSMLLAGLAQKTDRYPLTREMRRTIATAAALHDIGKMEICEDLLHKEGPLTEAERRTLQSHTLLGAQMLEEQPECRDDAFARTAYNICRWHHERYDGGGYPDGLQGEQIPIEAQVVGLADVYERLVSRPVDGHARTHSEVVQMICTGVCGAFNPLLLDCLQDMEVEIARAMQDTPEET